MDRSTITVPGLGRVSGEPDTVVTQLGVNVTGESVAAATLAASTALAAMSAALRAAGVADRDLRTSEYSVSPQYRYPSEGAPVLTGFQVTNTMSVRIRDAASAGAAIDAAVAAGGDVSVVNGIGSELSDPAAALVAARTAAFEDAMARAEQLAAHAGGRLGRVVSITELPAGRFGAVGGVAMAKVAFAATPVQPGEVPVEVGLEVVVEFGPGAQDTD